MCLISLYSVLYFLLDSLILLSLVDLSYALISASF